MYPILTMIGGALCASYAGSAIIEYVFSWPAFGRPPIEPMTTRDVTMTMGLHDHDDDDVCPDQARRGLAVRFGRPENKVHVLQAP
jgi:hypothetical protein